MMEEAIKAFEAIMAQAAKSHAEELARKEWEQS